MQQYYEKQVVIRGGHIIWGVKDGSSEDKYG
jgi:hypothetical protein